MAREMVERFIQGDTETEEAIAYRLQPIPVR
jgi:hypothetical protein